MFKSVLKRTLKNFGYVLLPITDSYKEQGSFVLYDFKKPDGSFDYERYKSVQMSGNKEKLNKVWVKEGNIKFLSDYIKQNVETPQFGICHGTRRGLEQEWFRKYLECEVIGTEISDTASQFSHTIQWDFHEVKQEWIGNVDFIYSNSFDHSFDPEKCINAWMSCLSPKGICILEHTSRHGIEGVTEMDPFGAELVNMPYLLTKWSRGKFAVKEILDTPDRKAGVLYSNFIILKNF